MGRLRGSWVFVGVVAVVGCGSGDHTNLLAGNGNDAAAGGNAGNGGQASSGGSSANGGSRANGGSNTGSSSGTGGTITTGGAGGTHVPEGGTVDAGTGGTPGNGGTGGTLGNGGTGGTLGNGGAAGAVSSGGAGGSGEPGDASSGIDCKRFCQRLGDLAAACGHIGPPGSNCESVCNATKDTCDVAKECFACTGPTPTVSCGDASHPVLLGCEQKCDNLEGRCGLKGRDAGSGDSGNGGGGGNNGGVNCTSVCTAIVAAGCALNPTFDACKAFCETAKDTCPAAESCFQCGGSTPTVECSDAGRPIVPNCAGCSDLESQCADASP